MLTFKDIENMNATSLSNLTEQEYKHLTTIEKQKVKMLIKTNRTSQSAHSILAKDENANISENVSIIPTKKKKFEETHTKKTYWINNETLSILDQLSQ
ncbi:hypothetical protein V7101_20615, partial [Bacillus velezensis]